MVSTLGTFDLSIDLSHQDSFAILLRQKGFLDAQSMTQLQIDKQKLIFKIKGNMYKMTDLGAKFLAVYNPHPPLFAIESL